MPSPKETVSIGALAPAQQPHPVGTAKVGPKGQKPVAEAAGVPAPPARAEPVPQSAAAIDQSKPVDIGNASGVASMMPVDMVLGQLGQPALDRIARLRKHPTISGLADRMRMSEGQCAPVIFTWDGGIEGPVFFHGYEALAAAQDIGLSSVLVVTAPSSAIDDLGLFVARWAEDQAKADLKAQLLAQ